MASLKSTAKVTTKLALTGGIICAIAWAAVVYQPDGSVKESDADILDLSFIKLSNSARFARGLKHLGHDSPQTFDMNGNIVNFSVNHSRKRPEQLMKEYQDEFVHQGLNTRVWDASSSRTHGDAMLFEAMTGGIVPISQTEDYVSMGGVIPKNDASTPEELFDLGAPDAAGDQQLFKGHHFVEMFWDRNKRASTVTASWSDENFDYRKMVGLADDESGQNVSVDVPACPGCVRLDHVRDLDPGRSYSNNIFTGPRSQSSSLEFYRKAMTRRGWRETESSATLNIARPYVSFQGEGADLLQMARGSDFLTILGFPDGKGDTVIHTTISK